MAPKLKDTTGVNLQLPLTDEELLMSPDPRRRAV